jgi:hypothetical protein
VARCDRGIIQLKIELRNLSRLGGLDVETTLLYLEVQVGELARFIRHMEVGGISSQNARA